MEFEKFKRNVALTKLGIYSLDNVEELVYDFLLTKLSNLFVSDEKSTSDVIVYSSLDIPKVILHTRYGVYVNYEYIWYFFEKVIGVEENDIKKLLKWWFRYHIDIEIGYIGPLNL